MEKGWGACQPRYQEQYGLSLLSPHLRSSSTEKQLLETICFQIQLLKPENIPKPPYNLATPKESSPPVLKSAISSGLATSESPPDPAGSGKGKQPANILNANKPIKPLAVQAPTSHNKGARRRPVPPEPLPPFSSRVSAYSPAISTGILVDAVKAGMNNPDPGILPGTGTGGNSKGKRKFVRVRG